MNSDLVKIKKYYGEKMMHLCRELFPSLLEKEGVLFKLLESNFNYSKFLYEDLIKTELVVEFKNYIYSLVNVEFDETKTEKTPQELLQEAGYDLYECNTEEDIQSFKKYYAPGEELCTFRGGRLNSCHVFFAVKKNADKIKREDFKTPDRQDEYGTSVISIQFSRGKINTLSIKNRYNHTVNNPDFTFSNNLENIIKGLTNSFEKKYNLNINQNYVRNYELPGYVKASNGKYYKYNYEIHNIYYCTDNIIIKNFEAIEDYTDKGKYIIMDYFIVDLVNKKITLYDNFTINDSFVKFFEDIKNIEIIKDKETHDKNIFITLSNDEVKIVKINKYNRMIYYKDDTVKNIPDSFLNKNVFLEKIDIPNAIEIGWIFLAHNKYLKEIMLPNVKGIGSSFLSENTILEKIDLPELIYVCDYFLSQNVFLETIKFPKLKSIGSDFLMENKKIKEVDLPSLIEVGNNFLCNNESLKTLSLPSLKTIAGGFMAASENLVCLSIPEVYAISNSFLSFNNSLIKLYAPKVEDIAHRFMQHNNKIQYLDLPNLRSVRDNFLSENDSLFAANLPKLESVGNYFLCDNKTLRRINIPCLKEIGSAFLVHRSDLLEISKYHELMNRHIEEGKKLQLKK